MDRVLGRIKIFCAAGKFFLEHSRYTLGEKIPLRTGGRNAPQAIFFLLSRFLKKNVIE
eukprot:SAG25_NODE_487_length_7465_cov_4.695900_4_plen_58_part_00